MTNSDMTGHGHHKEGDSYSNAKARAVIVLWLILTPIVLSALQISIVPKLAEWLPFFDLRPYDFYLIFPAGVLFVVFWGLMDRFLFTPYEQILSERERASTGAEHKAEEELRQAAKLREEYDAKIREVRADAMQKKMAVLQQARDSASKLIEKAENESEEILRAARWEIATNIDKARSETKKEVEKLADQVVAKVKLPPQLAEQGRRLQ